MSTGSPRACLRLRAIRGLPDAAICRLLERFGSPEAVLGASSADLAASGHVGSELAEAVHRGPDETSKKAVERELKALERLKVSMITVLDEAYPSRLKTIPDPPPFLYTTGTLLPADTYAVAIVGSRKATAAGRLLTEELSRALASAGFTIVSGLARGIDAAAHRGALVAKGRTVAVLGCGIDRTYPPEHEALRKEIESAGAVISELPLGAPPHAHHFPRRNRIISGLCLGVLVTEATLESGSLITARLAADQGREVFAVPGSVKAETSRGPHRLIKQGAKLVERVEDVLEELLGQLDAATRERVMRSGVAQPARIQPDTKEVRLYDMLSCEPIHVDDLIEKSGLSAAEVSGLLLSMELKALVRQLPGPCYVRI